MAPIHDVAKANRSSSENATSTCRGPDSTRQPMASPQVRMTAIEMMLVTRSELVLPRMTPTRDMGSVRSLSMRPDWRSLARYTAVKEELNVSV